MTAPRFDQVPACWVCGATAFVAVHEAVFELSIYAEQDPELAAYSGARVTLQRCRACGSAQPPDVLTRVRAFLCPGGWLAIKVPNGPSQRVKETLRARLRPSYRATLADNLVHVNHFSAASLARAMTAAGFHGVTVLAAAPELPEDPRRERLSASTGRGPGRRGRTAAYPR